MELAQDDIQGDGAGGSEVPTKSLEHTWRLRNLLEISILLTNYESAEQTVPAVLELFSRTLSMQSAIALMGPTAIFMWKHPALRDEQAADALEHARTSYEFFVGSKMLPADAVFSRQGVRIRKEGDADTITLPITTKKEQTMGLVQIIGHRFDEPDLLYLNAAVNQLALAVRRDIRTQEKQATSDLKTATAEEGKVNAETQRDEAESARRLQENLLSMVSHDLKNPLSAILLNAEYTLTRSDLAPADRRRIEAIQNSAERMTRLTNDLLDWANIDMGKFSILKTPTRVGDLVHEAVALMNPMLQKKNVRLEIGISNAAAEVWCDRDRILQVFSNLLANAVRYTPGGGRIDVHALTGPGETVFSVSDSGPGIAPEFHHHVFERFWQLDETARIGSGLGLAISKDSSRPTAAGSGSRVNPARGAPFTFPCRATSERSPSHGPEYKWYKRRQKKDRKKIQMTNEVSDRFKKNIGRIMSSWEERANNEVEAALHQHSLALRNSLPEYLGQIADALSTKIDRTKARARADRAESTRVGKKHGRERAGSMNYTIDQLIFEYHILRQVIFDIMEEDVVLSPVEREVILTSVEQAVNDAATQFSDTLWDIQETLTDTLTHDLRGPLTAAKASAQLVLLRPENIEQSTRSAQRISHNMDRLDAMIHDLLDASRIRAGESLPLEFEECDLDLIAKDVVDEANITGGERFVLNSDGACLGYWSGDGIRRLMENLTTNAVKYGAPESPITVVIQHTEEAATLTVHNQGTPIPKDEQAILFQQFRRARSTENKTGWGLGLTLVKGMAEAHGGSVNVESQADQGTTFTIELPRDCR